VSSSLKWQSATLFEEAIENVPLSEPELRKLFPRLKSEVEQRGWLLCRGDAFDLLPLLPPASIDLILTSPPYWGQRSYGQDHNWEILADWQAEGGTVNEPPPYDWYRNHGGVLGLEPVPEWFIGYLADFFDRAGHALKPQGNLWINLGDTYFARWSSIRDQGRQGLGDQQRLRRRTPMGDYRQEKQLLMIPARFAITMQERRWILRNDLIWHKPNVPPRPERDRLRLSHEHFFHFVKRPKEGRPKYFYDMTKVEREMNDVVICNVRAGEEGHSATFPESLIAPRIASSCPPGGLLLDPFCGSGRALATGMKLGCRAVGFDKADEYLEISRRLLAQGLLPNS
jgi:site-specific DNA-methyltransferase (cytosine-N4-specific)